CPTGSKAQTLTAFVPTGSESVKGTTSVKTGALPHRFPTESLFAFFQIWPVFSHQPEATMSAVQLLVKLVPRVKVADNVHQPNNVLPGLNVNSDSFTVPPSACPMRPLLRAPSNVTRPFPAWAKFQRNSPVSLVTTFPAGAAGAFDTPAVDAT